MASADIGDTDPVTVLDDLTLADRARARDGSAFVELLHRQRRLIYAAIYTAAGPTPHADDIAQEVAMAAWRGIHRVRESAAVSSWLWVVSTRCARRWRETHDLTEPLPADDASLVSPDTYHADRSVDRLVIDAALAQLPEHERAVVVMHLIADLSYRQIAEHTGLPMGTVQSRYGRGLARLRDLLAASGAVPSSDMRTHPDETSPPTSRPTGEGRSA